MRNYGLIIIFLDYKTGVETEKNIELKADNNAHAIINAVNGLTLDERDNLFTVSIEYFKE